MQPSSQSTSSPCCSSTPFARRLPGARPADHGQSTRDDNSFCQANGTVKVGSPEYIACRKDRDVQQANANARTDRRQRNLGEYMLNNPTRP